MEPILFYDFPSREIGAWNPQTWKTRYTLNIKAIPYKTIWVEYPDVEALCQKIGAAPTGMRASDPSKPLYTLPAIYDPNTRRALSDSAAIVRYLDATYPEMGPTLVPPALDALLAAFHAAFLGATFGAGHFGPLVLLPACTALNSTSAAYFRRTRELAAGPLEALAPPGSEKRAEHWRGAEAAFGAVARWLEAGADGKERLLFGGGEICFADVTVAAFLKCLEKLLTPAEWEGVLSWNDGRWAKFLSVFKSYQEEDSGSLVDL